MYLMNSTLIPRLTEFFTTASQLVDLFNTHLSVSSTNHKEGVPSIGGHSREAALVCVAAVSRALAVWRRVNYDALDPTPLPSPPTNKSEAIDQTKWLCVLYATHMAASPRLVGFSVWSREVESSFSGHCAVTSEWIVFGLCDRFRFMPRRPS